MVAIFPNVCILRRSYARNWEVLALKNYYSIEPRSYASTAYVAASYGPRFFWLLFHKKFGQVATIFLANGLPPPWQKIARTPMMPTFFNKCWGAFLRATKLVSLKMLAIEKKH